jgi:sugar phosphate isomerase/epimerase
MMQGGHDSKLSFFLGALEKAQRGGELAKKLTRLKELSFKAAEFSATDPAQIDSALLSTQLNHCELKASALLTGGIYSQFRVCFASPEASVREEAVRRVSALMPLAHQLGALLVLGLMQGQRADAADRKSAHRNIIDCLKRVGDHAERQSVHCVLEPVNHLEVGFNHTVADASAVLNQVGSSFLHIMADTFHLNIEESSVEGAIRACNKDLSHFHLCETNRCTFGSGHLDFQRVFRTLNEIKYEGYCTVISESEDWNHEAETAMRLISHALDTCD